MKALWLIALLALPTAAAAQTRPALDAGVVPTRPAFQWTVPEELSVTDVSGTQVVQGMPMKLLSASSRLDALTLLRFYADQFRAHGLFIPPPKHQLHLQDGVTLTGLDVDRLIAYTVMLRPLESGKGTRVLLSTTAVEGARSPGTTFVPTYPGATSLMTTQVEGGRTLSYAVGAKADDVLRFYALELVKLGFKSAGPNTFTRQGETVTLHTEQLSSSRLGVVVRSELIDSPAQVLEEPASPR